jgi:hypothetical protein
MSSVMVWLGLGRRIHRSRQFIPHFDFVAVGITEEQIRLARTKLTVAEDLSSGCFHRAERRIDIGRLDQPKTEMSHSSGKASLSWPLFKNEHVARAGCLRLNKAVFLVDRDDPEYFLVEPQRTFGISNRKSDVCQTVCSDRGCACHRSNGNKLGRG